MGVTSTTIIKGPWTIDPLWAGDQLHMPLVKVHSILHNIQKSSY